MCSLWIVNYKHKFIIATIFFLLLAVFIFILNKPPFKWYKVPTMLLEIIFVHCYKFFLIIACSFSVFVENCILLPKGIDEFVVFLCIVLVWFWFVILLPRFLLLVIKGKQIPRTKIMFQSAFFFQVQKCSIEIFLSE
jgi:hypothetical protein